MSIPRDSSSARKFANKNTSLLSTKNSQPQIQQQSKFKDIYTFKIRVMAQIFLKIAILNNNNKNNIYFRTKIKNCAKRHIRPLYVY